MKPKSIVTCLPSKNLERSLKFYKECFRLEDLEIEDDSQITIEIANLSIFIMRQEEYEKYTQKAGLWASYPNEGNVQVIHSCAVSSTEMIDHVFASAQTAGGKVAGRMEKNEWGQNTGYVCDPDGHLWEITQITKE